VPLVPNPADETAEISPSARDDGPSSGAPTTQLERPPPTVRGSQIALIFVAVAAASFLVGLALASGTRSGSTDASIATREIGPAGGTIRFDGGQVRVPEGAVDEVVRFVVRRGTVDDRIRVDAADSPIVFEPGKLTAYRFEPEDVTFRKPVELLFRLPVGARNGTVFARRGTTIVLLSGTVDADRGTATTHVRDFRFGGSD
jgi:hypothetical protein